MVVVVLLLFHFKNLRKIESKVTFLSIKKSEKFDCDCGSNQIRKGEKARHEKTKKHLEFISNKI